VTDRDSGQDVMCPVAVAKERLQMRGALRRAPAAAARAHRAALAGERHEAIQPTAGTVKPRKPTCEDAAAAFDVAQAAPSEVERAQEPAKLLFDESRQPVSVVGAGRIGAKGLEVVPHDL
jgi:hypothetical protein